jgi:hypothetical protein
MIGWMPPQMTKAEGLSLRIRLATPDVMSE